MWSIIGSTRALSQPTNTGVKFITRYSPVALHFGSLDTRILQLTGSPGGWQVKMAECASAQGSARHSKAAAALSNQIKTKMLGKDATLSTSAQAAAVTVVPIHGNKLDRLVPTLEEAAVRVMEDSEGINYRYLPMDGDGLQNEERLEYLLLCLGQAEMRRCVGATEALNLRPVGLELAPFPVTRALVMANREANVASAFLHLGFDHSLFGIAHGGELRFLKPMEGTGASLLDALHRAFEPQDDVGSPQAMALGFLGGESEEEETEQENAASMLAHVKRQGEEQNALMMRALRQEGGNLGMEVRACLRHFQARNPGISVAGLELTGFGAGLPCLAKVLEQNLKLETEIAQPFTKLGISAPAEVLREQHLWCAPLGLALRGYE
jgi:Tfp pilus assembly PilM family ATPase